MVLVLVLVLQVKLAFVEDDQAPGQRCASASSAHSTGQGRTRRERAK